MSGIGFVSKMGEGRIKRAEAMEKMAKELGSAAYAIPTGKNYTYKQMLSAYTQINRGLENFKNGLVKPEKIQHLISDFQKLDSKMQLGAILKLPPNLRKPFLNALPENLRNNIIRELKKIADEKKLLNPNMIKSSTNVA